MIGRKITSLAFFVVIALGASASTAHAAADKATMLKALQANPAVKGAIASVSSKTEKCPKPVLEKYDAASGQFQASISCESTGNEGDGGGISDVITLSGTVYDATPVLEKIEFAHAD